MEIKINERNKNAALNREEIKFKITHFGEKTPKRNEVRSKIAAEEGMDKDLIIIDELNTENGSPNTKGYLKVYEDKESLKDIENEYLIERNVGE